MTANQIAYAKAKEEQRHNVISEVETQRHNEATEEVSSSTLRETQRANLVKERQNAMQITETKRSNLVKEAETARHNVAGEQLQQAALTETNRSNLAREQETKRSNLATEAETRRTNLAREQETQRHNYVSESTEVMHNQAQHQYWYDQITSQYDKMYTDVYLKKVDADIAYTRNIFSLLDNLGVTAPFVQGLIKDSAYNKVDKSLVNKWVNLLDERAPKERKGNSYGQLQTFKEIVKNQVKPDSRIQRPQGSNWTPRNFGGNARPALLQSR